MATSIPPVFWAFWCLLGAAATEEARFFVCDAFFSRRILHDARCEKRAAVKTDGKSGAGARDFCRESPLSSGVKPPDIVYYEEIDNTRSVTSAQTAASFRQTSGRAVFAYRTAGKREAALDRFQT